MPEQNFTSPNELMDKAIELMLDGEKPSTHTDWAKVVNFWAYNVHQSVAISAVKLLCMLFDCPLPVEDVLAITAYQISVKQLE